MKASKLLYRVGTPLSAGVSAIALYTGLNGPASKATFCIGLGIAAVGCTDLILKGNLSAAASDVINWATRDRYPSLP